MDPTTVLRRVVAKTVNDPADADAEIAELPKILSL